MPVPFTSLGGLVNLLVQVYQLGKGQFDVLGKVTLD